MTEPRAFLSPGDPCYGEVLQFLYHEARLLDSGHFDEWLALLTEDMTYRMPVRQNRRGRTQDLHPSRSDIFSDDFASLRVRVNRLKTSFAWAEDPPSRTRHLITNVSVVLSPTPDEVQVFSNFLVYRNRSNQPRADLFCGEREDLLRRVDGDWRLARRIITLDQAVVGARHISILL